MPPEIEFFNKGNKSTETGPPITLQQNYIIMDAMFEWDLTPEQWRNTHYIDQARMMAYIHVKRVIESYISDWYRKRAEVNKQQ